MMNGSRPFKFWRIIFLLFSIIIALFILFQNQINDAYSEYKDLKIFAEKKAYFTEHLHNKIDIKFTDACDKSLRKFADLEVQKTQGCTEIACPPETPCCNSCFIKWYSETDELKIHFAFENPILNHCQIDGCGKIHNCDLKPLKVQDLLANCQ